MDIQELAARAASFFEVRERPPAGPGREPARFTTLKDRFPVWVRVRELAHKAHGDMMPDDFRYEAISHTLDALAEGQDPDEPSVEADVYTHDLLEWLGSNLERAGYVDEAVGEFGHAGKGGSHGAASSATSPRASGTKRKRSGAWWSRP